MSTLNLSTPLDDYFDLKDISAYKHLKAVTFLVLLLLNFFMFPFYVYVFKANRVLDKEVFLSVLRFWQERSTILLFSLRFPSSRL